MHFVIFTGGTLTKGKAVEKVLQSFDKVIAVDSGALHALSFGIAPDYLVGDFDSIDKKIFAKVKKQGSKILRFPDEKDLTDTEIGIQTAIKNGATKITVLGGIEGDRIDHILANILLHVQYKVPIFFINHHTILWAAKGPASEKIDGQKNDLLSLIPLSTVTDIHTKGLKYMLKSESLIMGKTRGISNVFTQKVAEVSFLKGTLLFVHTLLAYEA